MTRFQSPKGTQDILAPESARWSELVGRFAVLAQRFGFGLVVSPGFEDAEVFRRSSGDSSDVVTKEMYEFTDRGGRDIALRPEGTASVVRAFVQHSPVLPFKAWYAAPMFRYERPQAGRFRQHHQLGVETLGTDDPMADVEVISLLAALYARPWTVVVASAGQLPRRQQLRSGLSSAVGGLSRVARRRIVRRASLQVVREPAAHPRLQAPGMPGTERGLRRSCVTRCARTAGCTSPRSSMASTGSPSPMRRTTTSSGVSTTTPARPSSTARTSSRASAEAAATTGSWPRSVARRCPASASEPASSGSCSPATPTASFLAGDLSAQHRPSTHLSWTRAGRGSPSSSPMS